MEKREKRVTMKKTIILAVMASFLMVSAKAAVVAAWDFNTNAVATSAGWTSFNMGASNSNTVGGLTLTQAAGSASART